ncbi:MAG: RnfABCDGE type electron transport complex subunit D [Candidatus Omnitrophica bacterium]|nr:RnfABCDGE type electron transport complex subunit D [Candidatus Omnitrophota bacterium]
MNKKLVVSLSPHTYGKDSVTRIMYDVLIALVPAFLVSIYMFGFGALRVTLIAIFSSVLFEYLIQKFMLKVKPTINDGSAIITGLLLAFNVPSNLPWWMIIVGSFVAIGIAKMSFGGLGNNPFNPALVGRVFLFVSFPVAMTSWPVPIVTRFKLIDAVTSATPLSIVKEGLKNNIAASELASKLPSYADLFFGNLGGCIGEVSALALLLGGIYLIYRKVISWHIPVAMIGAVALFSGILWGLNPEKYMDPMFQILTGGVFLGAIFMATDMVTSPMTPKGMIIFGILIGLITVVIRVFGAYPEGVSFAILIMNAFVPLIDKFCKPQKYGVVKVKNG